MLHKVEKDRNLNPWEIIYLDIISQQKPSCGGSNNWIIIQDSDIKQKSSFFTKAKEHFTEKVTPLLNKMKAIKKIVKIIYYHNTGENNTLE